MASHKDCQELISYFIAKYEDKFDRKPQVNRNTARWDFENILYDMSKKEAKELLDFYFEYVAENELKWFFFNYDKLIVERDRSKEDEDNIKELKRRSAERVKEWRESGRRGFTE